jgi:transcriptional regulator with XRE-family HTH domain
MRAKELKEMRAKLGLTQKRLAELVGIAPNNLAKQERGELGIRESLARLIRMIAEQHDHERQHKRPADTGSDEGERLGRGRNVRKRGRK